MADQCPQTVELERLIRGRITEWRAASLTEHLDSCPACQERMELLAAGGDQQLTTTVRTCRSNPPPSNSALWPALSAVAEEVATTGLYSRNGDTDASETDLEQEVDLKFLQPASDDGLIGRLGDFEIKRVVGRGGMGVVLQGYDPYLQRDVAIKVLDPQLAGNEVARKRFCREARAAAAVTHANLVTVHQVDEDPISGLPYLVMQLVVGESLEARLKRVGKLPPEEVAKIGQQAAAGLAAAHAGGLIHRDIKPGNILLESNGDRVKLTDFGLARGVEDVRLTRTGFVAGTPLYMAPEQAHGENIDHRSDLFSLGSVLYEAATGKHPFEGKTPLAVLRRVSDELQPALRDVEPTTPHWLSDVIDRLLAKDPKDRFQSAAEVAEIFSLELARHGIELPAGCGKTSAYALRARKPICWKSVSFRLLPWLAGAAIGALAVAYWPGAKTENTLSSALGASTPLADPGQPPKHVIPGQSGPVWAVGFTPDGERIILGAEDGTLGSWKLDDLNNVQMIKKKTGAHVWGIDISKDGEYLVAPSDEQEVEVFDLKEGRRKYQIAPGASTKSAVFTPNGQFVITGDRSGTIRIWDRTDGIPDGVEFEGHRGTVHGLAVSPDSQQLASAGSDGMVRVWSLTDPKKRKEPQELGQPNGPIYSVAFSPKDEAPRLASAGWDGTIRIWNPKKNEQLHKLTGHEGDVFAVTFDSEGKLLASAGVDGTVRVWDVESGKEKQVFHGSGRAFHIVRFSPKDRLLAAGSRDGSVRIWEIK